MADNAQKTHFALENNKAAYNKVISNIQRLGKPLPASLAEQPDGSIVKVKFEMDGKTYTLPMVTMPLFGPEYIRYPMQKGDKGYVLPGTPPIGNMSGLGPTAAPQFTISSNLGALVFHCLGNKNWTPPDDKNAQIGYGPTGTIHRDTNKKSKHVVHPDSGITSNTGKKDDGTYKQLINLHPTDGGKVSAENGDHITTWNKTDGIKHKSKTKVTNDAPTTEATKDLTVGNNASIAKNLSAATGSIGGFGMGGGGGGGGAGSLAMGGNVSGSSVTAGTGGLENDGPDTRTDIQYVVPLTGDTVALTNSICILDPAGTLATLEVDFPATPVLGQLQRVSSTTKVTALTLGGGTFAGNAPTAFPTGGGQFTFIYYDVNTTWYLI